MNADRARVWSTRCILLAVSVAWAHEPITTNLTWTQEISRIVYKHCKSCHREGGSSFSLVRYEEARPWAKAIRDEVLARRMPPWDAVKGVGEFRDDASLTPPEMDMLVAWVEGGAPEGDRVYLPRLPDPEPPPANPPGAASIEIRNSVTLARPTALIGIHPEGAMEVTAYLPDGAVRHLIWIRNFRKQWERTYWFRDPIELPQGPEIVVYRSSTTGTVNATVFTTPLR